MKGFTLCFVYLLIAVCNVKSASYYYRAGREVIVPSVEEMITDLKVPMEKLELISADEPTKITTVAETVKNAAVEAVRQIEEIAPIVSDVKPVEKVEPIVSDVAEVKSNVVVDEPKSIVPVVPAVEAVPVAPTMVEPVIELKSNVPDVSVVAPETVVADVDHVVAVKETPVSNVEIEQPNVKVVQQVIEEVKSSNSISSDTVNNEKKHPIQSTNTVRQSGAGPIETFGHQIQTAVQQFQHTIQQIPVINALIQRPSSAGATPSTQSDAEVPASMANAESTPMSDAIQQQTIASSTASPPNLLQNALNSITSFLAPRPTTAPPAVASSEATPAIVSGTRGDESVQVVQNIDIVDDKVDYAKHVVV